MGILTMTAISTGCFGACTKEETPDMSYDFLVKQEDKKDGLEVYKPKSRITHSFQIKCPLCKFNLPKEERTILQDIITNSSENKLDSLFSKYNEEADSADKIDNISDLGKIYNQIQEMAKTVEAKRFYKHTCTRNEECKRTENQDIYFDLCFVSPQESIAKNLKVDYNKLKTDENYRQNYLDNKKIAHEKYIRTQKRKEIEDEYRSEFEDYTFLKERNLYEEVKRNFKFLYEQHLQNEERKGPYEIRFEFQASSQFALRKNDLKYSGSQKRFLNFVRDLTGQNIYENITMGNREYKEFQKFILERDSEYADYLD